MLPSAKPPTPVAALQRPLRATPDQLDGLRRLSGVSGSRGSWSATGSANGIDVFGSGASPTPPLVAASASASGDDSIAAVPSAVISPSAAAPPDLKRKPSTPQRVPSSTASATSPVAASSSSSMPSADGGVKSADGVSLPLATPLGSRPALVRLSSSSKRASGSLLGLLAPNNTPSPVLPSSAPSTSRTLPPVVPESPELQPLASPGRALQSEFCELLAQNEALAAAREVHRAQLLRAASVSGDGAVSVDQSERRPVLRRLLSDSRARHVTSNSISSGVSSTDSPSSRSSGLSTPAEGRPGMTRAITAPTRMAQRRASGEGVAPVAQQEAAAAAKPGEKEQPAAAAAAVVATPPTLARVDSLPEVPTIFELEEDEDEERFNQMISVRPPEPEPEPKAEAPSKQPSPVLHIEGEEKAEGVAESAAEGEAEATSTAQITPVVSAPHFHMESSPEPPANTSDDTLVQPLADSQPQLTPSAPPNTDEPASAVDAVKPTDAVAPVSTASISQSPVPSPPDAVVSSNAVGELPVSITEPSPPAAAAAVAAAAAATASQPVKRKPRRRVMFDKHLCHVADYSPNEYDITPQQLTPPPLQRSFSDDSDARSQRPRKGVLKTPSSACNSNSTSRLSSQSVDEPSLRIASSEPHSAPVTPAPQTLLSLRSPHASPAALLDLHIALFQDSMSLQEYCATETRRGAVLTKMSSIGKPGQRWFWVQETATEIQLCWTQPKQVKGKPLWQVNPNGLGFGSLDAADKPGMQRSKSGSTTSSSGGSISLLPGFRIGRWHFNQGPSSRNLLEARGVHYGPYSSPTFCTYLDKYPALAAKPWLCLSVEFADRSLDIICGSEAEVTTWFLGLQAQAPQTSYYMTRGMIFWQRVIMKFNSYGLDQIKRVFAQREALAAAQRQLQQLPSSAHTL